MKSDNILRMNLEDITVYTLFGKKHLYKLGDMAYGEWLIFQSNVPKYYLNIFDDMYQDIDEQKKIDPYKYLLKKFKAEHYGYSLGQNIHGIWSSKINEKCFDLEKLPISFFR
jgi:hypothetical protein